MPFICKGDLMQCAMHSQILPHLWCLFHVQTYIWTLFQSDVSQTVAFWVWKSEKCRGRGKWLCKNWICNIFWLLWLLEFTSFNGLRGKSARDMIFWIRNFELYCYLKPMDTAFSTHHPVSSITRLSAI